MKKNYVLGPFAALAAVLMLMAATMVSCQPKEDVEDPSTIISNFEIEGQGFMPLPVNK